MAKKTKRDHLGEFWHAANCAATARQRASFNEWRGELYLALDGLRDVLHHMEGPGDHEGALGRAWDEVWRNHKAAMACLCERVPMLAK